MDGFKCNYPTAVCPGNADPLTAPKSGEKAAAAAVVTSGPALPVVKPGWLTTEFWATIATVAGSLISGLAILGYLKQEDQQAVGTAINQGITGLQMFLVSVVGLVQYVRSRQSIKTMAVTQHTQQLADYHTAQNQRLMLQSQLSVAQMQLGTFPVASLEAAKPLPPIAATKPPVSVPAPAATPAPKPATPAPAAPPAPK